MRIQRHGAVAYRQRGLTMLEVLITIVILAFGLLGVAGLQARMQVAEIESYQRAQAIVLLQDMVDRIKANRKNAMDYVTVAVAGVGTPNDEQACGGLARAAADLCEWNNALLGASEKKETARVGAMIDARGCVANTAATMPQEFLVSVVWQGLGQTAAPTSTDCGKDLYGNGDEKTRRALVARVMIGCLQNDPPDSTTCVVTP